MSDDLKARLKQDLQVFEGEYTQHYSDNKGMAVREDARPLVQSKGETFFKQAGDAAGVAADVAGDVAGDVATGLSQAPRSAIRGATKGINSMVKFLDDVGNLAPSITFLDQEGEASFVPKVVTTGEKEKRIEKGTGKDVSGSAALPVIDPPKKQSVTGGAIESISQFVVGFKGVDKLAKIGKIGEAATRGGKLIQNVLKGGAADVLAFDEHEERLSNVIESVPALRNPITEYLQAEEDDGFLEGKVKQAIEGLTIGAAGDVLFDTVKFFKRGKSADDLLKAEGKTIDDIIDFPLEEQAGLQLDRAGLNVLGNIDDDALLIKTNKIDDALKQTEGIPPEQVARTGFIDDAANVDFKDLAGDELLDAQDLVEELIDNQAKVTQDGFVTVYHRTSPEAAASIRKTGKIKALEPDAFFSTKLEGQAQGFGDGVIKMRVPVNRLRLDDVFGDEAHLAINIGRPGKTLDVADYIKRAAQPKGVDIEINFARIDGPDDIKNLMQEMANDPDLLGSVKDARRGVQTDEMLLKGADDIDGFNTLMQRRTGEAFNDQQTIAARKLYYDSTDRLLEAAKKAADPNASNVDQFAFRKMIATHHAIQQEVLGARAEAARALRAWSLPVQGGDGAAIRQIEGLVNEFGGAEASRDLARRLSSISENGKLTTDQIDKVVNAGVMARSRKALEEAWTLGLLTSPRTHIVNVVSNVLTGMTMGLERGVASLVPNSPIHMREALEYYVGYIGSFKQGLVNGAEAWRTGQIGIGLDKIDLPPQRATAREVLDPEGKAGVFSKAIDLYGAMLNKYAGGALAAGDEFSKTILYNAQMRSLAYRQARHLGLTGQELKEHIADTLASAPANLRADSLEFANYGTYTNALTGGGAAVQKAISRIPLARFVVPFVRTPLNIFKFTFERTPLGLLSSAMREDIAAGGVRRAQAMSKIGMGTSVMFLGTDLALNGNITGAGPSDHKVRAKLRATGWQPYSIKIGDEYYSYSRWEPFATWLGMSADMAEIMTNYESYDIAAQDEMDELVTASVAAIANQVVGKTFLQGISDMTQVLADSKRYGPRFLQRYAGSFVPTLVADIERTINPETSQVFNIIDAMKARTPGLSDQVPPRRNVYGEIQKSFYPSEENALASLGERVEKLFNPVYYTDPDRPDNKLDQFFLKNGFSGPNMPQKTQKFPVPGTRGGERVAIDLRQYPEIYDRFLELRGEVELRQYKGMKMKEYLMALVNQDVPEARIFFNDRMMDHDKQDMHISGIVSDYDSAIREQLVEEFTVLRQTIAEEREASRALNINQGAGGLIRERPFP